MTKSTPWIVATAFFAGLSVAALFPKANLSVVSPAQAQATPNLTEFVPTDTEAYYLTVSQDGRSMTFWRFDNSGVNVKEYGPSLRWSKTYTAGQTEAARPVVVQ